MRLRRERGEEFADLLSYDYQQFIGLEHGHLPSLYGHVDVASGLLQTGKLMPGI
jgi:hypothetical protein